MKYDNFSSKDFILDEGFVKWVLDPTPESDNFWNEWLENNPHKKNEVEISRKFIFLIEPPLNFELTDAELNHVYQRALLESKSSDRSNKTPQFRWSLVASVMLLLVPGVLLYLYFAHLEIQIPNPDTAFIVKNTLKGQKKTIQLSDGSIVKLNANSRLKFPEKFDNTKREVFLEGEAFFEVEHDPSVPFIVYTNHIKTQVLGTSFNIKSIKSLVTQITVVTGKVLVSDQQQLVTVKSYEMAEYDIMKGLIEKAEVDVMKWIAWRDGILVFENEPLQDVINKLEDWYGVSITVQSGVVLNGKFSGEFNNESLEMVLNGIGFTSDFNYKINENKEVIIF